MSNTNYIWTHHASDRLNERKIPKDLVNQALYSPDKTVYKDGGAVEYQKRIDNRTFAAIVKENQHGEKIIVSCWVNPPYPGTKDAKQKARYYAMQRGSFWKKMWLTLLDQLGF